MLLAAARRLGKHAARLHPKQLRSHSSPKTRGGLCVRQAAFKTNGMNEKMKCVVKGLRVDKCIYYSNWLSSPEQVMMVCLFCRSVLKHLSCLIAISMTLKQGNMFSIFVRQKLRYKIGIINAEKKLPQKFKLSLVTWQPKFSSSTQSQVVVNCHCRSV
jgi:hypothetical protein